MFFTKPVLWTSTASVVLALASSPAAAQLDAKAVRFQPPGHNFALTMPNPPTHTRRSTSTVIGKVWTDVWASRHDDGDYSVAITDLPSVALWFNSEEGLVEKARDTMLETLGAKQSGLRTLKKGQFSQELNYFIPGRVGSPAQKGRAWFGLFDDKLVVITAQVPLSKSSGLNRHFSSIEPDVAAIARR